MEPQELMELQWPYLLGCLPEQDLEGSAREWGAIVRLREVDSASTLLRLALAYGFCQMSLRQTAAWAEPLVLPAFPMSPCLNGYKKQGHGSAICWRIS